MVRNLRDPEISQVWYRVVSVRNTATQNSYEQDAACRKPP